VPGLITFVIERTQPAESRCDHLPIAQDPPSGGSLRQIAELVAETVPTLSVADADLGVHVGERS
jgi:hypothetical protein